MKFILIGLIRIYQKFALFFNVRVCRFYPSCSEYMVQSIEKHGIIRGIFRGCYRIVRCNPFCEGGYDPA